MRCKTIQQKLDLFLAEELTATGRKQIQAHLQSCPDCRAELVRLKQLLALLKSDSAIPPVPEGFSSRLMAKASERLAARQPPETVPARQSVPGSLWRLRWLQLATSVGRRAAQAAVLAGGLLMGVLMGQRTWQSAHPSNPHRALQADPVAVYELDYLSDAPAGSLTQAYLTLTRAPQRDGA